MAEEVKTVVTGLENSASEFARGLSQSFSQIFEMTQSNVAQKTQEQSQRVQTLQVDIRAVQKELASVQKNFDAYKEVSLRNVAEFETKIKECNCAKDTLTKYIQDLEKELKECKEKQLKHETIFNSMTKLYQATFPQSK